MQGLIGNAVLSARHFLYTVLPHHAEGRRPSAAVDMVIFK